LDNDTTLTQFAEIEQKVERLIDVCKALETKNRDLANTNAKLEEELRVKTEAEKIYQNEKERIRSKIDGLLKKLDEIKEE
jgi:chromosome segregation ATPase